VFGAESHSAAQLLGPCLRRLAGPRVDQVDGEAREGARGGLDGADRGGCVMVAAEERQRCIVQRLQPQRQAVDAGVGEGGEARRLRVGGIGFQGDFEVGRRRPEPPRRSRRGPAIAACASRSATMARASSACSAPARSLKTLKSQYGQIRAQ
jgi:hypothetical protein